jgi:hypothetical protein
MILLLLISNMEAQFGNEVWSKMVYKLPERQDLKLFALTMMMAALKRICRVDTVLELECCCISSSILNPILAMLLGNFQLYEQGNNGESP